MGDIERRMVELLGDKPGKSLTLEIGRTLQTMRMNAGITQSQLAQRAGMSRPDISRLERAIGSSNPNLSTLARYAAACGYDLRFVAKPKREAPRIITVPAYRQAIKLLAQNPREMRNLGPEELEALVRDRLQAMGYACIAIGATNQPDGGIDLIACPNKPVEFPYLLGIQVKSHQNGRRSGSRDVRDLFGAISGRPFHAGVLVTNTTFTMDARWFADQHPHLLRLRDMHDLRRWIVDDFAAHELWREIPPVLELRPGLTVDVRKSLGKRWT